MAGINMGRRRLEDFKRNGRERWGSAENGEDQLSAAVEVDRSASMEENCGGDKLTVAAAAT